MKILFIFFLILFIPCFLTMIVKRINSFIKNKTEKKLLPINKKIQSNEYIENGLVYSISKSKLLAKTKMGPIYGGAGLSGGSVFIGYGFTEFYETKNQNYFILDYLNNECNFYTRNIEHMIWDLERDGSNNIANKIKNKKIKDGELKYA